ncbi:MAG: CHAT domain-containing protein [Candidatus Eisenbacteria bacterium]|nr:CHAT domain-containing protein [Candidatus Eisenbacteria bacterium]
MASDEFRERLERRKQEAAMTCDRLAEILPPGGGIVHFVRYPDLAAGARSAARQMASPILPLPSAAAERYGAFCLAASAPGAWTLSFHDLGEADFLDTLIVSYRRSVEGEGGSGRPSARAEAEFRVASRSLHRRAWEPIAARFAEAGPVGPEPGAAIVLLIPDSELLLVDFNTLLSPADELVIERWSLHNLSSARDLLRLAEQTRAGAREGLLAVGCSGPDPAAAPMTRRPASTLRSARPCDIDPRSLPPLSGAVDEARRISDLYSRASGEPVTLLVGPEATEGSAKRLMGSSRIIHLAAHGFFCGREAGDGGAVTRDAAEDPLLLSGLVLLAGPAGDDGILFAQEVVGRDMRGTDWAVLSACASGRGVQLFGDGLSGLRRAFEIAGVRTVLTSMWHIRDDVARDLMVRLYTHRLSGESTVEAVRGAQLERLREVRSRFRRIHPALWGGIVAEGDWR